MSEQPDTAKIRAHWALDDAWSTQIHALCDALDAARGDAAVAWTSYDDRLVEFIAMKIRADAAEARIANALKFADRRSGSIDDGDILTDIIEVLT